MAVQWYTATEGEPLARLLAAWKDAPIEDLESIGHHLATARKQIIAYAPALPEGGDYPDEYALAQLNLARNLWNDDKAAANGGNIGADGFTYSPPPLPWKHIVRPINRRPDVY